MEFTDRMILSQQLSDVTKLIKAQYLAGKCGFNNARLTRFIHIFHADSAKPTQEELDTMNVKIHTTALIILSWPPITYGSDVPAILKERKKIINLPYIFEDVLGHTRDWVKKRMTPKCTFYNRFTEQDITDINNAITVLGTRLKSIHLL